jgi:hypothetical protein
MLSKMQVTKILEMSNATVSARHPYMKSSTKVTYLSGCPAASTSINPPTMSSIELQETTEADALLFAPCDIVFVYGGWGAKVVHMFVINVRIFAAYWLVVKTLAFKCQFSIVKDSDDLLVGKVHLDVLMLLMRTLLTLRPVNQ